MTNPVVVEVTRGPLVESRHRAAVALADATGKMMLAVGDVAAPVFPRSAIKVFQALPLVEEGAADRYGFGDEELALACASHSGEPAHVAGVERMLGAAGLDASALRCGAHWPLSQPAAHTLAKTGAPSALHNNCSGKHAGFLCVACAAGLDHADYWRPQHPVQRKVRAVIEDFTGAVLSDDRCAIDGCSVPTWAIPLENLARGFAKFANGQGLAPARAATAARLRDACARKPWHIAGTGRFCTEIMQIFGARVFVKTGAEGVYCGALPEQGLGIAVKCDDGAGRAAQAIVAAIIARFLPIDDTERAALAPFVQPVLRNWNGLEVGAVRVIEPALRSTD
ncbi:MAG TPA: asparaginase [Xanthobacteraceae bacterium]|nr:asparaginase [Xanthobacteraceae bacterium]